jgi:putative two-component system response regulator
MGQAIARSHHERWDGGGYPDGLAGEAIPLEARICAIVDFFDALTMDRPYRRALEPDTVLEMMRMESGKHFDPGLLQAFFSRMSDIHEIRNQRGLGAVFESGTH